MDASPPPGVLRALPAECRDRLMRTAQEVSFASGARLFDEGGRHRDPGPGELVRWSWLFGPHGWHLRAPYGAGASN
ncbi:hypothetical protein ACFV2H_03240 [Streptomyces sp. NPDC059629]|uniref:hypothetical protein n=1 Tax=Streptomyces sp. NPDC059629 TaxID=3346889 RepID=UPI003697579C